MIKFRRHHVTQSILKTFSEEAQDQEERLWIRPHIPHSGKCFFGKYIPVVSQSFGTFFRYNIITNALYFKSSKRIMA